jgi:hypothetical protein
MQSLVRRGEVLLALAAILACAPSAYADSFSWSISGSDASGSGSLQATDQGSGAYLVTSMTGTLYIDGVGGPITGIVPTGSSGLYLYDDLIFPSSTPELEYLGLVFGVTGFTDPMNLCADPGCNLSSGSQAWVIDNVNGNYSFYPVEFTTPEPSVLALLSLGLVAFTLALRWNRWERRGMASRLSHPKPGSPC